MTRRDRANQKKVTSMWPAQADLASPTVTAQESTRVAAGAAFAIGAIVGRYRILGRLGEGGMGVVYEAHDSKLEREVALKVLRHVAAPGTKAGVVDARRSRLVREARAMAKLAHENVVPVFDAGVLGDEVFVTMELVAGESLEAWAGARRRSWREVLAVYLQAARGLAAAHGAGIVHRDVKPSNLLLGDDGRVRVVDFGLAVTTGGDGDDLYAGTPAFMAPEQRTGIVDERSDQYSFALALERALEGTGKVPASLRRVLRRATSERADARFGAMTDVVRELTAIQRRDRRRRGALVVVAAAVATGAAAYAVAALQPRDEACEIANEELAGVWDGTMRERLISRFAATDHVLGGATATAVAGHLDRYTAGWLAERAAACRELGDHAELLARRYGCLDRALAETRALTELFASAVRAETVRGAITAVLDLPRPESCRDLLALEAMTPLPAEPSARARIVELRRVIDRAAAHRRTGEYAAGLALAAELPAAGRALRYAPVEAEALLVAAELEDWGGDPKRAEQLYREAALAAGRAGDDARLAAASAARIYVLGVLGEGERALEASELASALAVRSRSRAIEGLVHNNIGATHVQRGELAQAAAAFEQALAVREQALGGEHPLVANTLSNLGAVRRLERRFDDAEALHRRALAIKQRVLGAGHPEVGQVLTNLGAVASARGDNRAAAALEAEALALARRALGEDHVVVAQSLNNLGSYAAADKRWTDATPVLERAVAIFRAALPAGHPNLGRALASLGEAYVHVGRAREALPLLEEAVAIQERAQQAIELAHAHYGLGFASLEAGEPRARGCDLVRRARDVYRDLAAQRWQRDSDALLAKRCAKQAAR